MLRYLDRGTRQFDKWPIYAHKRANWEFYAVIKGHCGMLLEDGSQFSLDTARKEPLQQSHLWLFPPLHFHGWYGLPNASCEILVFHFNAVPALIERAMAGRDFLEVNLAAPQRKKIIRLARALEPDYRNLSPLGTLRTERALIDLCLVTFDQTYLGDLSSVEEKGAFKVKSALAWFGRHLRERPSLEAVAAAVHVSPTHLRRLFVQFHGRSPHQALVEIQLETASRLLAESDEKLDSIAVECGFSNASNLCRAFKTHRGYSPSRWRKRLPGYANAHHAFLKAASPNG
ncbi:MAG: helix-turn-helix domain-containing protein [Chthoniobacteraceae bacterium]